MKHFLDCGANTGQTLPDFLSNDSKWNEYMVWCFEPSIRHLPALQAEAALWSGQHEVRVCPFGLHGSTGTSRFYTKDDDKGDSFEDHLASDHLTINEKNGYVMIGAHIGICHFLSQHTKPNDEVVLKLDCEGSEYAILEALLVRRAFLARISGILVEWHTIGSPHRSPEAISNDYATIGRPLGAWLL